MPDNSYLTPYPFSLEGGLVLDQSTFSLPPGAALELENFEPDIRGGYRRINGHTKWNANEVPYTTASTEEMLLSAFYEGEVIAARGEKIFRASSGSTLLDGAHTDSVTTITVDSTTDFSTTGTLYVGTEEITYTGKTSTTFTGCTRGANGTSASAHSDNDTITQYWTNIDTGRTSAERYNYFRFNLAGTEYILLADGVNNASYWDGSTMADVSATGAPADPAYTTFFKDHAFYAGMSSNPQEVVFAAPFTINDFTVANGAGSFLVDTKVTGMIPFRGSLYIFGEDRIYRLVGSSESDFNIEPVTRNIGCRQGNTIKEFAGDVIFLGPDGLRTVAGTERIGDVELGTISRPIQKIFDNITADGSDFVAVVIPEKTQYRLFLAEASTTESLTKGVICSGKGRDIYEFAEIKGIKPSCTDNMEYGGTSYVLHGGYDGFVYRQEQGNDFSGTTIVGKYRSVNLTTNDAGIRKSFQRLLINFAPEGVLNSDVYIKYDYEDPNVPEPAAYPFDGTKVASLYGATTYGTATYGGQAQPMIRQPIEGSGFAVAVKVVDSGVSAPYSLKGFQVEYSIAARR